MALFCGKIKFVSLKRQDTSALLQERVEADMAQATLGDWNLGAGWSRCVDVVVGANGGASITCALRAGLSVTNKSAVFDPIQFGHD